MKMVKSLLLGSAAGLVAVAGAQAADLPVKAKPVQYVKICTLYGDGFYYIPGSDTCLKVFGYVRADYGYNVHTNVPQYAGDAGANDRNPNRHPFTTRHRLNWSADARTQTPYGTLRAFTSLHVENRHTTDTNDVNDVDVTAQRAFIQWAGFTFGHTQSLADVPGQMGDSGIRSLHQNQTESTTGASGLNQISYSWNLGSGARLTIGADERRVRNIGNMTTPNTRIGGQVTNSRTGQWEHSPFISLLVNQAWGTAGVAFIAQNNRAVYYTSTAGGGCGVGSQVGTTECLNPDDKWAWGVRGGAEFKLPMIGPGDRFLVSAYYSEGAIRFTGQNLSSPSLFGDRGVRNVAFGFISDSLYVNGGQQDFTTAWSVNAGFEHYWTPNFSTAWYGGYIEVSYSDAVINARLLCGGANGVQTSTAAGVADLTRRCDGGFALYHIGSVTNWFPAPGFRLAVDVMYTGIDTAMAGFISVGQARGLRPTGVYVARNQGVTSVMFRAQRNWGGN